MTFEVPALAAGFASKFDTIGPYVGFASLIAVVAMAVLVFAQGRELQRLREWAGSSPERLTSLENRIDDELRQVRTNGAVNRFPGQAAGAAVPVAAAQGATAARPAAPGAPPAPPGAPGTPGSAPAAPGQGTSAGGAPGAPGTPGAPPRPTPPRPGAPIGPGGQATRVVPGAAGPGAATAAGRAASARSRTGDGGGGSNRSIPQLVGVAGVGLVVLVAILFALGVIGGGDDPKNAADSGGSATTPTTKTDATPRFSPAETNVTVLNASGTPRLAATVTDILDNKRFQMGEAGNYTINGQPPASPLARTSVEYQAGSGSAKRRQAALFIAKALKVSTRQVKPMTADTRAAVQDIPDVAVIIGQDYAEANPRAAQPESGASTTTPSGSSSGTSGGSSGTSGSGTTTGSTGSAGSTGATGTTGGTTDGGVDGGTGGTTDGAAGTSDGAVDGGLTP